MSVDAGTLRILDAHHHFWNFEGEGYYPWLQGEYNENFFLGDYTGMLQTFLPEQYLAATAGYSVIGTVHTEAERDRSQEVDETRFLESLHAANPAFPTAIVAHASLAREDAAEVLEQQAASPLVRGIRSKPVTSARADESVFGQPGTLQDPRFIEGLSLLEKHDLSWDLRVPYWHLVEAAEVIAQLPGIPVIINHCGLPLDRTPDGIAAWRVGMEALAALPNTAVKVSELGLPRNRWDRVSNEEVVAETVAIFGYGRSMFASNLPVATLTAPSFGEVVDTVLAGVPHATPQQLDRLFSGTAADYYRIDLSTLT